MHGSTQAAQGSSAARCADSPPRSRVQAGDEPHGAGGDVRIGVVGGEDIVARLMSLAQEWRHPGWTLVGAVYAQETEAYEHAARIAPRVDVVLFAGPFPYDLALARGVLPVPATYVPIEGPALFGALLSGTLRGVVDPLRVSVDSLPAREVRAAYTEVGLDPSGVHVQEYAGPASASRFAAFHRELFEAGATTGAVTTVPSVAKALTADVPTLFVAPAGQTLRGALRTAALMGSGARVESSRIVTMIVRIPVSSSMAGAGPGSYSHQELKLALHRELLREARPMDAAVMPRDDLSYLVVTTMGSLDRATEGLTVAPFVARVARELGLRLEVGIGLGRTTREAESNAQVAVDRASQAGAGTAYLVGPGDPVATVRPLRVDRHDGDGAAATARRSKNAELLDRLLGKLAADGGVLDPVVDADKVAALLGTTPRTARRALRALAAEGLAWPVPPARSARVGRPPQPYHLLVEPPARTSGSDELPPGPSRHRSGPTDEG